MARGDWAAGLVTHTTMFRELTLRELRPVRVPAPHGLTIPAGVASLRPAHGRYFTAPLWWYPSKRSCYLYLNNFRGVFTQLYCVAFHRDFALWGIG